MNKLTRPVKNLILFFAGLTAVACSLHSNHVNISCPHKETIKVEFANYGRTAPDHEVCPYGLYHKDATNCARDMTIYTNIARNTCDGKQSCTVEKLTYISDPCQGTYKYLEVHYDCTRK